MSLTKGQMLVALDRLITEAKALQEQFAKDYLVWTPAFVAWLKACESTLEAIYGGGSAALASFRGIYFIPPPSEAGKDNSAPLIWYYGGLRYATSTLIGYRYSIDRLLADAPLRQTPYVFISHGGPTRAHVDATRDLLTAIGIGPVIVNDLPSMNMSVNDKVVSYMRICTAAIVLATEEDEAAAAAAAGRPRPNVENEVGMLQLAPNIANRIIYLKEPGVQFASNYREKVWIPFMKERVSEAFTQMLRELRAFGVLG
jgi:hypothetical protein